MIYDLKKEINKEYEMLIEKSMKEIEKEQTKMVNDSKYVTELASLYVDVLKNFTKHNCEEEEKTIDAYIDRIIMITNVQENDYIKKAKNNIIQKIRQEVIQTDKVIEKYVKFRKLYNNKLEDINRKEKEWVEIKEKIDDLTIEELHKFKDFTNKVSEEIYLEMNKKSMTKSILTAVALGLATVTGVFLVKKVPTETKDVVLKLGKDAIEKLRNNSSSKEEKIAKGTVECINEI